MAGPARYHRGSGSEGRRNAEARRDTGGDNLGMSRRSCPVVGAKEYPRLTVFMLVARFARRTSEVVPSFAGARALVTQQSRQRAKWSFALIYDHVESSRTSVRRLSFSGRRMGLYGYRANVICHGARAEPAMRSSHVSSLGIMRRYQCLIRA